MSYHGAEYQWGWGGVHVWEQEVYGNSFVLSTQFCSELKIVLKNQLYLLKKYKYISESSFPKQNQSFPKPCHSIVFPNSLSGTIIQFIAKP